MSFVIAMFQSIISRRDTKVFFSFCLFPLLVPLLSANLDVVTGDYTQSFLSFLQVTIKTQYQLILPVLMFAMVITSAFRDEIDSGILFLYKDINRKKLFRAKMGALCLVYLVYLAATTLASAVSYYGFMVYKLGTVRALFPTDLSLFHEDILTIWVVVLLNLLTIVMVSMVSITSKTLTAVLTGVLLDMIMITAPLWVGLKYISPLTYVQFVDSVHFLPIWFIITVITTMYIGLAYYKSRKDFQKVEF